MLFDLNVLVCIADLSRYESGKAGVDAQVATAVFLKNECDTWKDNLLRQFHRKRTLRGAYGATATNRPLSGLDERTCRFTSRGRSMMVPQDTPIPRLRQVLRKLPGIPGGGSQK